MKTYKHFCTFVFILISCICMGQDKKIMHIDSICNDIEEQINQGVVMPHTISYIVNRPAIGIQKTTLDFYYNALSSENWDYDPKTDSVSYVYNKELHKVVMNYNIAASENIRKTYYYEKERLIFFEAVIYSGYENKQVDSLRVYFLNSEERKFDKYVNGTV